MPLYDRQCGCGWNEIDRWEPVTTASVLCPSCGNETERAWLTKAATVIGDECDFIQHNGTREPIRFRSKAEFKRWLKEHSYRVIDTHVPEAGTDKSKFTTNWSVYDPYTAENVRILLERAFTQGADQSEAPLNMDIRTFTGELTTEEVKKYAGN